MTDQLSQDDLLAVVDRVVPETYLQPIKDVGPGYELYQGSAAVGARCSLAVQRFYEDGDILTSRGGVLATVPVTFFRSSVLGGGAATFAGVSDATFAIPDDSVEITVSTPSGVQADDTMLILAVTDAGGVAEPASLPAGWTQIAALHSDNETVLFVFRRIATGSEPATHVIQMSGGAVHVGAALIAYRGLDTSAALVASAITDCGPTTEFPCPGLTLAANDLYIGVVWVIDDDPVVTPPAGTTERIDVSQVSDAFDPTARRFEMLDFQAIVSGATGTETATIGSARSGIAASLALSAGPVVRVLAGTVVSCSASGQSFITQTDAVFGPTDLVAQPVTARATGFGYEYNIRGPFIDARGGSAPGDLDTIDMPLMDPVFGDPSIQVRNDFDSDGLGRPRALDLIGRERDVQRQQNESDQNYRARIMTLPDTITPAAIKRQVANYVRQIPGLYWRHVETWDHAYQECFDAPEVSSPPGVGYDATMFIPDDPRPPSPIRNRYLGNNDYLGAFIIEIDEPTHIAEYGFALDDPADTLADVTSAVGVRAFSAFDVPDTLAPPALVPSFDGRDYGILKFLSGLFALLESIKAGGVFVVVHIKER